jgi:hypothetical protein
MPFAHKMMGMKTKVAQELQRQVRKLLMMAFWVSIANEYSEVLCVDVQLECL